MQKILHVLKTDTAKNTALIFFFNIVSYIAFLKYNMGLFNIAQAWFGLWVFCIGVSVVLSLAAFGLGKKYSSAPTAIVFLLFTILLTRGFWNTPYEFLYNWSIGWAEMPLRLIILGIVLFGAYKTVKKFQRKVIPVTVIFALAFLGTNVTKTINKISERAHLETFMKSTDTNAKTLEYYQQFKSQAVFKTKPNIYHIVVDSYPNHRTWKKLYNVDVQPFYKKLRQQGFSVFENGYSPSGDTSSTMTAIFQMQPYGHSVQPYTFIGQNKAWGTLFMGGYKAFCEYPCSTHPSKIDNMTDFIKYVDYQNYSSIVSFYLEHQFGRFYSVINTADIATNFDSLSAYYRGKTALKNIAPFVSYVHHVPSPAPTQKRADILNESVLEILQDIETNDPDSIIILHSDHGSREKWMTKRPTETDSADEIFGILSAVKFPPQCNRFNTLKNIAPVNYYAYIHACLRGEDTPKIVYSADSTMVGKTMKGYWGSRGGRKTYTHIKDGVILEKPVEFVAEPLKTTQKRIGLLPPE